MIHAIGITAAIAVVSLLSACGGRGSSSAPAPAAAAEAPIPAPAPAPAPQYPAFTTENQVWFARPATAVAAMREAEFGNGGFLVHTERAGSMRVTGPEHPAEYRPAVDGALRFHPTRTEFTFDSTGGTTLEVVDDTATAATVQIIGDVNDKWVALGHWMTLRGADFIASAPNAARPIFNRDTPVEVGAFIEGPGIFGIPGADGNDVFLPVRGSASYEGPAIGLHAREQGETRFFSKFTATATFNTTYEFNGDRLRQPFIQGRLSNISSLSHSYPLSIALTGGGSSCAERQALCDSGVPIAGTESSFSFSGGRVRLELGDNDASFLIPTQADASGSWQGRLSSDFQGGHPAAVGGTFAADGLIYDVRHVFVGAYYADIEPESVR